MKINTLETHDRYKYFTAQSFDIAECCEDLIKKRPFGSYPFYIFSHPRTIGLDEKFKLYSSGKYASLADVPEKTIIWQPRLTKPEAQPNSMLFKAYPGTDLIKVLWILPPAELWEQYEKDKMMGNQTICESIEAYRSDKRKMEEKEPDDLDDRKIREIYREMANKANRSKLLA